MKNTFSNMYSRYNRQSIVTDKFKSIHQECQRYQKAHFEAVFSTGMIFLLHFLWKIFNLTYICGTSNQHARKRGIQWCSQNYNSSYLFYVVTFSLYFSKCMHHKKGARGVSRLILRLLIQGK